MELYEGVGDRAWEYLQKSGMRTFNLMAIGFRKSFIFCHIPGAVVKLKNVAAPDFLRYPPVRSSGFGFLHTFILAKEIGEFEII